jgi:hypothetical protein
MLQQLQDYLQQSLHCNTKLSIGVIENDPIAYTLSKDVDSQKKEVFVTVMNDRVLLFAMLFSEYSTKDEFHLYIEKIDSSGHDHIPGLASSVVRGVLNYYVRTHRKLRVQIYCATAEQYLFHRSHHASKKVHSDRDLIKWWLRVVDQVGFTQKFWVVPGETILSVKRMLPSADWHWGLGIGMSQSASKLPLFEDDMVQKGVNYSDPNATVEEVLEVMGCMETAGGMRAILVLKSETTEIQDRTSYKVPNYDELRVAFATFSFATVQEVHQSSREWKSLLPEANQISFAMVTERVPKEPENGEKGTILEATNLVKPKEISVGVIKRKPEIRDLTNLVKKKKVE